MKRAVTSDVRSRLRWSAVLLCVIVVLGYLAVFFVLRSSPKLPDDPTPLFAFLAGVYAVGMVLLLVRDHRSVLWVGVGVQVVLIAGYLGITVIGETEFALRFLVPGIVISLAQVVLAGALVSLALTKETVLAPT